MMSVHERKYMFELLREQKLTEAKIRKQAIDQAKKK